MKVFPVLLCTFTVAFGATIEQPIEETHHFENGFEDILFSNLDEYLGLQIKMITGVQKVQVLLGNIEKPLELVTGDKHTEDAGTPIPDQNGDDEGFIFHLRSNDFQSTLLDYLGAYQEIQIKLNTQIEKLQLSLGNVGSILEKAFTYESHDPLSQTEYKKLTKPKAKDSAEQQKN